VAGKKQTLVATTAMDFYKLKPTKYHQTKDGENNVIMRATHC